MKKSVLWMYLAFFLALAMPAWAEALPVVASFSIIGDMARVVGGDAIEVKTLVGPNADTHSYQPVPDDAKKMAEAKIIFVNGFGLEGWMDRLIAASGSKAKIVVVSEGVKPRNAMIDENGKVEAVIDPHAWQDLSNGRIYVKNIAAALKEALPDRAKDIDMRAKDYDRELMKGDKWVKNEMGSIPASRRKVITSHDAFGYFGQAYGVTFLAPQGINTEAAPSAAGLAQLIDQIKAERVKVIFLENMNSPRLAKQLAKDSGAALGDELYSDALSKPEGPASTYLAMFKNNVPKLKDGMLAK